MQLINVIGNIGSGKSTFTDILKSCLLETNLNVLVVDLDEIGHEVLKDEKVLNELMLEFGNFDNNKELANKAFADIANTKKLNEITHKHILNKFLKILQEIKQKNVDYVLIEETACTGKDDAFIKLADTIICVYAHYEIRKKRCISRGMTKIDFKNRVAIQQNYEVLQDLADITVNNSGTSQQLKERCKEIVELL